MSIEYAYDKNGNLSRDDNKGMTFTYDLLGHPLTIAGSDNQTDYVYSADGRKLRATHTQYISRTSTAVKTRVKTDYRGRIVANDGSNIRFLFDGGFYTFKNGALDVCHYFIQDYQGNNRILIGSNGQRDQYSHYYPYGGLMGDISTNDPHSYKYGGKELDRDFGIDLFDFEARQYDAKVPGFTSIDPHAEKYYSISPYAYCAGDPVNCVDPTGMDTLNFTMREGENVADYSSRISADGDHVGIIFDVDGNQVCQFSFVYQDDANKFMTEDEYEKLSDEQFLEANENHVNSVTLVSMDDLRKMLIHIPPMSGGFRAWIYAWNESRGEMNSMDFVFSIKNHFPRQAYFIPQTGSKMVMHNSFNFGNYLWGAAMKQLGINYRTAVIGAHIDNMMHHWGTLDSEDDQYSIRLGYSQWPY